MTVKPLTFGTREYTAWAKRGEEAGESKEVFTKSVEDLYETVNRGSYDTSSYYTARDELIELFNLEDQCEDC